MLTMPSGYLPTIVDKVYTGWTSRPIYSPQLLTKTILRLSRRSDNIWTTTLLWMLNGVYNYFVCSAFVYAWIQLHTVNCIFYWQPIYLQNDGWRRNLHFAQPVEWTFYIVVYYNCCPRAFGNVLLDQQCSYITTTMFGIFAKSLKNVYIAYFWFELKHKGLMIENNKRWTNLAKKEMDRVSVIINITYYYGL